MLSVDHLVYAAPDLETGIDKIEQLLGVRATPGGRHPDWGTRNALVALGQEVYLEIIGPDPEQPAPAGERIFQIDVIGMPRLVSWAAKASRLSKQVKEAAKKGVVLGEVKAGSRTRPDGSRLSWQLTDPARVLAGGIVPFLIDWGDSAHPAQTAVFGGHLVELRAEHPDPGKVTAILEKLNIELPVRQGAAPALTAVIEKEGKRIEIE